MTRSKGKILISDKVIKQWIREIKKLSKDLKNISPQKSQIIQADNQEKKEKERKQMTNEHFKSSELATNKRKQYFPPGVERWKDWVVAHIWGVVVICPFAPKCIPSLSPLHWKGTDSKHSCQLLSSQICQRNELVGESSYFFPLWLLRAVLHWVTLPTWLRIIPAHDSSFLIRIISLPSIMFPPCHIQWAT